MTDKSINYLATIFVVSSFGAVILVPALADFEEKIFLWWLLYLVATSFFIGLVDDVVTIKNRILISLIPSLLPLIYIAFNLRYNDGFRFSSALPTNPKIWEFVLIFVIMTWIFAFVFSFAFNTFIAVLKYFLGDESESQFLRIGKAITALSGVTAAIGLLAISLLGS